jgi:Peptidase S39
LFFYDQGGAIAYSAVYISMGVSKRADTLYELEHDFSFDGTDNDFVILEAKTKIETFSWSMLKVSNEQVSNGEDLFVLHFPGPGTMVLTRADCHASDPPLKDHFLHHTCDTDRGSSGAPIFNGKQELVAVHGRGGYNGDPSTFNVAIAISTSRSSSAIFDSAMTAAATEQLTSTTSSPVADLYQVYQNPPATGAVPFAAFLKRGDVWLYRVADDDNNATPLQVEDGAPHTWTFWDPPRDEVYKFPEDGGPLSARPAKRPKWNQMGFAAHVKVGQ